MSKARALKLKKKYKGGSNELDEIIYRLSLKLPIHEVKMIVERLGVTDMISFLNKTDIFGKSSATYATNINFIKDNITKEAAADSILSAVIGIREEIEEEKQELIGYLKKAFTGRGINPNHNTSYIAMIMRTLKLGEFYDLIDVKPKDINDINDLKDIKDVALPQIYKEKLLALQKYLKKKHKVITLLMNTKILTLYEAKTVINSLEISYNSPETFIYFSQEDIDSIDNKILSKEKKKLLWEWIKSYNINLLMTKLKKNFSKFITERIIIGIEEYLKKNTGRDVYYDFHMLFDKKNITQYLILLKKKGMNDIKRILILKNIKNRYDLIKLDLNSIEDPRIRGEITNIQASFLEDNEYILNIIERAKDSVSYSSSSKSSSPSKYPSSKSSSPSKCSPSSNKCSPSSSKRSSSSSKSSRTIAKLLELIEKM